MLHNPLLSRGKQLDTRRTPMSMHVDDGLGMHPPQVAQLLGATHTCDAQPALPRRELRPRDCSVLRKTRTKQRRTKYLLILTYLLAYLLTYSLTRPRQAARAGSERGGGYYSLRTAATTT